MVELKPRWMTLPSRFSIFNIPSADASQYVRRRIFRFKTGDKPGMDDQEGIFMIHSFILDEKGLFPSNVHGPPWDKGNG